MKTSLPSVLFFLLFLLINSSAYSQFSGGDGSVDSPYLIANAADLDQVRFHQEAHFRQTANIDLGTAPWNENEGWQPIGIFIEETPKKHNTSDIPSDSTFFSGTFDGNGFHIINLFINRPETPYAGLFGYARNARFENIRLDNTQVTGKFHVGALAGDIWATTVTNCHSSGDIVSTDDMYSYTGGLVGTNNENSTITASSSSADVTGTGSENRYTGGLAGQNRGGLITESRASGDVTGYFHAGGLVGWNAAAQVQMGPFAVISNSYATGTVTGLYYYAGGLAGSNWVATIEDSYATGDVFGNFNAGGLAGHNTSGTITSSHAAGDVYARADYAGGLVGGNRLDEAQISMSYATGNVVADGSYAGGLVGYNLQGASIRKCFATGGISSGYRAGGLVGVNGNRNDPAASIIEDSYATGHVLSYGSAGGLVGENTPGNGQTSIFRSYAVGFVTPYATHPGGLVGTTNLFDLDDSDQLVENSFYNSEIQYFEGSFGGEPKTMQELISAGTFSEWDLANTWTIIEGESYPYLAWQDGPRGENRPQPGKLTAVPVSGSIILEWPEPAAVEPRALKPASLQQTTINPESLKPASLQPTAYHIFRDGSHLATTTSASYTDSDVENYVPVIYQVAAEYADGTSAFSNLVDLALHSGFAGGRGTADDPFLVRNPDQLYNVRYHRSQHFLQTGHIDMTGYEIPVDNVQSAGWQPIGEMDVNLLFSGTYDGGEYLITNLSTRREEVGYAGLFGYIRRATLKNIILQEVQVSGFGHTGGLAGYIDLNSVVYNCHVRGTIEGIGEGWNSRNYGGLVGYSNLSQIDKSSSGGLVDAGNSRHVGGLAGYLTLGHIQNSYSFSNVTADVIAGGLVGWNADGGVIRNSYATGSVLGTDALGGLVAVNQRMNVAVRAVTENSYWDTERSGNATSDAGDGRTTEQMTWPYDAGTFVNWDFDEIWIADTEAANNEGYPYLLVFPIFDTEADDERHGFLPKEWVLSQNYPNPFNPVTTIRFEVPESAHVRLDVYSITGQKVATLVNGETPAGMHQVHFDAGQLAGGVYLYRLSTPAGSFTKKLTLIK